MRNIEFSGAVDEDNEDADINKKAFDFLCLKHALTEPTRKTNQQTYPGGTSFWIGHGKITKVLRKRESECTSKVSQKNGNTIMEKVTKFSNEGKVIVSFDLHPLSADPPMTEATDKGLLSCGVEILIKSEVDRSVQL